MSRKHIDWQAAKSLTKALANYAKENAIEIKELVPSTHVRLADPFVTLDVWPTTRKYYIVKNDPAVAVRNKGALPDNITDFLDRVMFARDLL